MAGITVLTSEVEREADHRSGEVRKRKAPKCSMCREPLPDPPDAQFEIMNKDAPCHFAGPIEIRAEEKLWIRWGGESEWQELEWWEILAYLREPNPAWQAVLQDICDERKSRAYEDGFEAALEEYRKNRLEHRRQLAEGKTSEFIP